MNEAAIAATVAAGLALGAVGVVAHAAQMEPVMDSSVRGNVEACATGVVVDLDLAYEADDPTLTDAERHAWGLPPVPSISYEDALEACAGGGHPDFVVYEDGSYRVIDTDREWPDFVGCAWGMDCTVTSYGRI